jgi:carbonic anhydrase
MRLYCHGFAAMATNRLAQWKKLRYNAPMPILPLIEQKQAGLDAKCDIAAPGHDPVMLLIGCVDARKDPIADLGVPKGSALILRNVAALVHPEHEKRLTESAALAFAVRHMKVKRVVVMGHTDCGGIRAALAGSSSYSLRDYLQPIRDIRDKVCAETDDEAQQQMRLEQEAIKYSVRSLRSYDYIADAEAAGELKLHGWLIDTGSGRILQWDESTDEMRTLV